MPLIKTSYFVIFFLWCINITYGQNQLDQQNNEQKHIHAHKMNADDRINFDGIVNETTWHKSPMATGFIQRFPTEGKQATEKTEVYVMYNEKALWIGFKAYDQNPDSIAASLFRRDQNGYSDWVYILIDSYNDHRTAFVFGINPKGVQRDYLIFNDNNFDSRWNAVWEAKTHINEHGWEGEFKIPLSQLRFKSLDGEQIWGINFRRDIARKDEFVFWSPTPRSESGFVSKFGKLKNLIGLTSSRRIEISPYASSGLSINPDSDGDDPYDKTVSALYSIGGDATIGITSNITLNTTFNPDFGQVEADPASINLTAFELFFPERRQFFLEGIDIFEFGRTNTFNNFGNPNVLYTRRIGRSPQGNTDDANITGDDIYTNMKSQTSIINATKVSGKFSGWEMGIINAVTPLEKANYTSYTYDDDDNIINENTGSFIVEPLTNYSVARIRRNFSGGDVNVGGYFSNVVRDIKDNYFSNLLHRNASTMGVDFDIDLDNNNYGIGGVLSYTNVTGNKNAILSTQERSSRYFQRPDSKVLSIDETRTSLNGWAYEFSVGKFGGKVKASLTYSEVSPGYESNDIGFMNRADYRGISYYLSTEQSQPTKLFRYMEAWTFGGYRWNFDGNLISHYYRAGIFMQFHSLWRIYVGGGINGPQYLDRLTRGGPIAKRVRDWNINFNLGSNSTKKIAFNMRGFLRTDPSGEYDYNFNLQVNLRPASFLQVGLSPRISFSEDTDQYVDSIDDILQTKTYGTRYIFANTTQTSFSFETRVDWAFTPKMSLQIYARPLITQGSYRDLKEFKEPKTYTFDIYGTDIGTINLDEENQVYNIDPDGNGPANGFAIDNPNFNYRAFQSNVVFRWEYALGSTVYIVWQQNTSQYIDAFERQSGNFDFIRDFGGLFSNLGNNTFLVKFNYLINL